MLKHSIDAAFVGREGVKALAVHTDFTGSKLLEAGDEAEKGSLAGTAFAQQGQELARSDLQGDILQNFALAETLGDTTHFQQDRTGGGGGAGSSGMGREFGHCAALTSFQISM